MSFDVGAVRHAYETIATEYTEKFADELETNEFDRAIVEQAISGIGRGLVLDVGCGPAQVSRLAMQSGVRATGVDLTLAMLSAARRQAPVLPLCCGDVLALPIRRAIADAVIAWYSLHNLPRSLMPAALAELRRVLRRGGVAVIATHGGRGEERLNQNWMGQSETVMVTYYDAEELCALAAQQGFKVDVLRERPPLAHEHQVPKLYLTASAT